MAGSNLPFVPDGTWSSSRISYKVMIPEAQRIAIAQACGWTRCNIDEPMSGYAPGQGMPGLCILPDYLNSLDAIFDAIKTMTNDQKDEVVRRIGWSAVRGCWDNSFIANATPAQWSRAFLQTLSLWVDSSESAS